MARKRVSRQYFINLGLSLLVLVLFAFTGLRVAHNASAATANPYGTADYCALEKGVTVIYGWAADPDATSLAQPTVSLTVGTNTVTTQTNRANYRDAYVADWIDNNRSGDPKPGTYGFRVAIPGLTKGNKYPISGTVLNEGPGDNTILTINNSANIDGDKTKPFFSDNTIPDACLADPNAQPAQTTVSTPALPAPKVVASDVTGATVTAGTNAALLAIKTDGMTNVRVIYGTDPFNPNQSSSDQLTTGSQSTVLLTGLNAASTYSYRVVRTDMNGKRTTSPLATFNTLGYVIALHFVDSRDTGIQGIRAELDNLNQPKTSDDTGTLQFTGIAGGTHTVSYAYLGKNFSKTFTADATSVPPALAATPQVITLDNSVDIQALLANSNRPAPKKTNTTMVAVVIAVMVVVVLGIIAFALVKLLGRRKDAETYGEPPAPPLPEYKPLDPTLPPVLPAQPGADHMGESLSDLVKKDFHDKNNPPGTPD